MPTTAMATALVATTVATGPTALATAMDSTTARGRLRLSPRLMPTTATVCTTARGRLRLSPVVAHAVAPVAVSHAVHAVAPVVSSYAQVSPSASLSPVGIAPAAIPAVGGAYAGAGRYVANSAGT